MAESKLYKPPKCEICNENEGAVWCHSDGGIGTPIRYGLNLHVCPNCAKTREDELESMRKERLDKNHELARNSLKKKIWSKKIDTTGMKHYAFQYWFQKLNWKDLKEYEEWLGFELSPQFKEWIEKLKCHKCGKHIRKPTDEEAEEMSKDLPKLGEQPSAFTKEEKNNRLWYDENGVQTKEGAKEWRRRYDEYLKDEIQEYDDKMRLWDKRFTILHVANKHLIKKSPSLPDPPVIPESLKNISESVTEDQLKEIPEYEEYKKKYEEYQEKHEEWLEKYEEYKKSEVNYHFCSEKCIEAAISEDVDLRRVLY